MTALALEEPSMGAGVHGPGRWVIALAALLVVVSAGSLALDGLERPTLLPLETVLFDGDLVHVSEADLRAAVAPHMGNGLFGIDVSAIRQSVEALPWVAGASVRRVWPDAVRITVSEQQPVARWGEQALLNAAAAVFRPDTRPAGLPRLSGPEDAAARVLAAWRRLDERLAPLGLSVAELALDERRSWRARLAGGGTLVLGREGVWERVDRLVAAWPRLNRAERRPARIDLRYPNGFAVRWEAGSSEKTNGPKG